MSGKSTRTDRWKGSWTTQILPRRVLEENRMLEQIFTMDDALFPGNRRLAFTHKQAKSVPDFKVLLDKIMTYLRTVWPATSWNPSVTWNRETPGPFKQIHKHAQPGALMSYEKAGSSQLPAKGIFMLLARWEALSGTHCASEVSLIASNALPPPFFMDVTKQCFFYTAWHLWSSHCIKELRSAI